MADQDQSDNKKKKKKKRRKVRLPYGIGAIIIFAVLFVAYNALLENSDAIKGEQTITVQSLSELKKGYVIYSTDNNYYWVDEESFRSVKAGDTVVIYEGQYGWQVKKPQNKRLDSIFEQRR